MKVVTVVGPPSSGKTSVILKTIEHLKETGEKIGVIKFDCLTSTDSKIYEKNNVLVKTGISGNLCPDHYFVTNIEDCVQWGIRYKLDILNAESAGLCNRCSPHIKDVLGICIIDNLSGTETPKKIGPMLKYADIVVITKGDVVSQAEREVFSHNVKTANPKATVLFVNGITGQGSFMLSRHLQNASNKDSLEESRLRFTMPASLCSYCLGQTKIGQRHQLGNIRKIELGD
jgi:Ni2+-binding GTPase involved in maturation of urease and hydrogenase